MTEQALTNTSKSNVTRIDQTPTPSTLLAMAVEQGADLDKLEKLMALQERWEANEARKAFVAALNAFKSDPPSLHKNHEVSFKTSSGKTEYRHATLDHVSLTIGAALSRNGLSHRWDTEQLDQGIIRVTCVITHALGHSERTALQAGADQSGGKNNIQAIGSTVTYLQRYTLLAATGMAVQGQDDDAQSAAPIERITPEQVANIEALITEVGADRYKFLKAIKASRIEDIQAVSYADTIALLERKRKANAT